MTKELKKPIGYSDELWARDKNQIQEHLDPKYGENSKWRLITKDISINKKGSHWAIGHEHKNCLVRVFLRIIPKSIRNFLLHLVYVLGFEAHRGIEDN